MELYILASSGPQQQQVKSACFAKCRDELMHPLARSLQK